VALGDTATGQYVVLVSATDGTHGAGEAFNWTVTDPVTITSVPGQTGTEGGSVSVSVSASDTSGGTLKYGAIGLPPGLVINPSTGAITGTMALGAAAAGTYTVTVIAGDSTYSASQTFDWGPGSPVTITSPGDQTNTEGDTVSLSISASDSGGTVKYSASDLPAGLHINTSSGAITGTVAPGASVQSPYTVMVTALDGTYGAGVTFTWTINNPITITDPGEQDFSEGESVNLQIRASDSESGTLSYSALGLPSGLSINHSTGDVSGTVPITPTVPGVYDILVKVADAFTSAIRAFVVKIAPSNFGLVTTLFQGAAEKGKFTYDYVSGPNFLKKDPIGYQKLRLDIGYPEIVDGRPAKGSFCQMNTVTTVVITVEDGKLAETTKTTYILDRKKLVAGSTKFNDQLEGPDFDKALAPKAYIVFSYVTKQQGFTGALEDDLVGKKVKKADADAFLDTFDTKLAQGKNSYGYLWIDSDRATKVKDLADALKATFPASQQMNFDELVEAMKIKVTTSNRQLIYGDGITERADLDGKKP